MLALLGANEVIFAQAGADAFRRDVKDFVVDFCRLGARREAGRLYDSYVACGVTCIVLCLKRRM